VWQLAEEGAADAVLKYMLNSVLRVKAKYVRERSKWKQPEPRAASSFIPSEPAKSGPKRATGGSKRAASGAFLTGIAYSGNPR